MKHTPHQTLTEALRAAIDDSGLPNLTIANGAGVERTSLIRFRRGELSLRLDNADRLAEFFGLELVPRKKRKAN